ncbi:sigma-70 family RNA polymerase sigma factor [Pseudonocardia humida]|uniref:Sigma-70 family RNA polymerase sigma factor n=1 Tax=Pseudonocardia humida TaxID=2800819 RepID=A0ABT1A8S7_9PSEU|nr:sigma-70 family RNA polymerase sigma factor [Pseudonocardia humida]MCO1659446.1 sigma-70 family RNA polymerase sigma factor [Pseudonocardia humida]
MGQQDDLAERFEGVRGHLRAVAYQLLGSLTEADDAVQEAWLRLARTDVSDVANLDAWLTTVVGRICLDLLRSRTSRKEDPLDVHLPDPVIVEIGAPDPEREALLADSVGLAMLVVLDSLGPAERLAFVLHDLFAVSFAEIARVLGRSTDATKMLASRARRRVRADAVAPDPDPARQREVVDAFLAASRAGDFDALVALLDPDAVLRADAGAGPGISAVIRGAAAVAARALMFAQVAATGRPVLVQGLPGMVNLVDGRPTAVLAWTVVGGRIAAVDVFADPDRLAGLL